MQWNQMSVKLLTFFAASFSGDPMVNSNRKDYAWHKHCNKKKSLPVAALAFLPLGKIISTSARRREDEACLWKTFGMVLNAAVIVSTITDTIVRNSILNSMNTREIVLLVVYREFISMLLKPKNFML